MTPVGAAKAQPRGAYAWLVAILVVGTLAHLPALGAPFALDDYAHMAMIEGTYAGDDGDAHAWWGPHRAPFTLFDFFEDSDRASLIDRGIVPWWTSPKLVVRFLRPLSSCLIWADYRLFGKAPLAHHVHSLFWWAAAVVAVYSLARRLFGERTALLGAAVFALAPCHAEPLAWLANREAVVSAALGTTGLAVYFRWRESRRTADAALGALVFALAFLAGEYTVSFGGYVLAMEAARPGESPARRTLGLAPFALPAAAYLGARRLVGAGVRGAGYYHDPLQDLAGYAHGAVRRFEVLMTSTWLGLDPTWQFGLGGSTVVVATAIGMALVGLALHRTIHRSSSEEQRHLMWLSAGSLLSMAPALAVEPTLRVLAVPMVGASIVVGRVLEAASLSARGSGRWRSLAADWLTSGPALALGMTHLVGAPVRSWRASAEISRSASTFAQGMSWVSERLAGRSTVVVARADSLRALIFAPLMLADPASRRWTLLSFGARGASLVRVSERTIELVARQGPLFPVSREDFFRSADGSLKDGDQVRAGSVLATVAGLDTSGAPDRLRFDFDRAADDPSILWVTETHAHFRELALPPVGGSEELAP